MLARLWRVLSRNIVTDVRDEISACLDCGVVQCVEKEFRTCPNRLARAAALKALRERQTQEIDVTP
jgi:hypothetical protein